MGKRSEKAKELLADKHFEETRHYSKKYAATVISIASVILCILTVIGIFLLRDYFTGENRDKLEAFVHHHWIAGMFIFLFVCIVQVVVALIPGEAVEVAAGVIFGAWWGTVICLVGAVIGSILVIVLVRKFGRKFVESLYPREKIDSLPILNNPKKRNATIFLLFLIPGTPKDFITYIIGLTEVSIPMYIMLTTVARIPSILTSTLIGDSFGEGKIIRTIILVAITALVSGLGYLAYNIIQKHGKKKRSNQEDKTS
ncbi:MAG: TVP38/TMEM64 family protein [Ruminococcaceae bacterium]|nr:TVP38/TMEM64 family protein [Oscillospiraceae bacterium]